MPWTLYRYILIELLKLLAITTVVLVTVISFAGAVKPLSEGLLGPAALARFILFTAPTMLVFALPFAAAFASTVVFIRMASDNEILACSASGLSYRSILLPPAVLGLAMTMSLFFAANYVIPYFYGQARQTIEQDLITVLLNDLNSGKSHVIGDYVIYADAANERPAPHLPNAVLQPERLIELDGMALGQIDDRGRVGWDATADRANILLFRQAERSWATIALRETRYFDPSRGTLGESSTLNIGPAQLPNPMSSRPKLFSLPQLRAIGERPVLYEDVRQRRDELVRALAAEQLRQLVQAALDNTAAGNTVVLASTGVDGYYAMRAPEVRSAGGNVVMKAVAEEPVTIEFAPAYQPGGRWRPTRRYEAQRAELSVEQFAPDQDPNLRVELSTVRVYDVRLEGRATERREMTLPRLLWPEPVLAEAPRQVELQTLMRLADEPAYADAPDVDDAADHLQEQVSQLAHRITAVLHDRAASAVACLMLTLLGAVLSIHLKAQMILVVYFWSFLLAILTILLIYFGETMASARSFPLAAGLGVIWSSQVLTAVIIGWVYCRLARN